MPNQSNSQVGSQQHLYSTAAGPSQSQAGNALTGTANLGISFIPPNFDANAGRGRRRYNKKSKQKRNAASAHAPPVADNATQYPPLGGNLSQAQTQGLNQSGHIAVQQYPQSYPPLSQDDTYIPSQSYSLDQRYQLRVGGNSSSHLRMANAVPSQGQLVSFVPDNDTNDKTQNLPTSQYPSVIETVPTVPSNSDTGNLPQLPPPPPSTTSAYNSTVTPGRNPYAKPIGQPFMQNYASQQNMHNAHHNPPSQVLPLPLHSSPESSTPMNVTSHSLSNAGSPIPKADPKYGLVQIEEKSGFDANEVIDAENLSICIGSQNL